MWESGVEDVKLDRCSVDLLLFLFLWFLWSSSQMSWCRWVVPTHVRIANTF
jgi:hypothetical protein